MKLSLAYFALLLTGSSSAVFADAIPYPDPGTIAPTPNLVASATGTLDLYFAGYSAGDEDFIDLCDLNTNVCTGDIFENFTTPVGSMATLAVNGGDQLEVFLYNASINETFSSIPADSADGVNHVYATPYSGTLFPGAPAGTFIGTEDLPVPGSDLDYNDDQFVFTDVTIGNTPEPGSVWLIAAGIAALLIFRKPFARRVAKTRS